VPKRKRIFVRRYNVAKRRRILLLSLVLITLVVAACSFVISLSGSRNQPVQQTMRVKDSTPQIPSLIRLRDEIALNSGLREVGTYSVKEAQEPVEAANPDMVAWAQQAETLPIPAKFYAKVIQDVKPLRQNKVIALTFDDGPWPGTTFQVLDILKKEGIKATFFWVGQNLQDHPKIAQQVVADGHAIGNHTWHHWYRHMNQSMAAHEIDATAELIYKTTGVKTLVFRPPGGLLNNGVADYAKKKNYVIVKWSIDSMDYNRLTPQKLVNNVMRKAKPGGIVLMHDGGGNRPVTVQALPQIIAKLKEQGYSFVTVPKLLEMNEKEESGTVAKTPLNQPSSSPLTKNEPSLSPLTQP